MPKQEVATKENLPPVEYAQTPQMVKAQVVLIQEVMRDVMQEGQHYGKIPGCGDKPTLFKAGAEKLSLTFRLRPIMDNDRDIRVEELPNGHKTIHVYCHIMNQAGLEISTGVGSCSTMESKFRYRSAEKIPTDKQVPQEYWDLKKKATPDAFAKMQTLIGGKGFSIMKLESGQWVICKFGEKLENPDIADTYNTVLKMAKKRAYVDGILSATAASDCFTQDIDDIDPDIVDVVAEPEKKQPIKQAPPTEAVAEAEVKTAPKVDKPKTEPVVDKPKPQPITKTVQGIIEEKKIKPFVNDGKAGNKYGCRIGENWYGTFNSKVYDLICDAEKNRKLVDCSFTETSKVENGQTKIFYNIIELKVAVADSSGQPAEPQDI